MADFATVILKELVSNEDYTRKVIPYIQREFFPEEKQRIIFDKINNFINDYNKIPSIDAIEIELSNTTIVEGLYNQILTQISDLKNEHGVYELEWLVNSTEKFCQERATFNAIQKAIEIYDGSNSDVSIHQIPDILKEAISVSFSSSVGHDYFEDAEQRWLEYTSQESKLMFNLDMFNKITKGGVIRKSMTIILGGTGVGKSLVLCDFASDFVSQGYNVMYFTLEMPSVMIGQRIDANLLQIQIDDLSRLSLGEFSNRVKNIGDKTNGRIFIEEYPTGSAHSGHFRKHLNDLKLKKNFTPDIIIVDYINICASARTGKNASSYEKVKSIAEEIRGLGKEYNAATFSATQLNRDGIDASDVSLKDTSESMGLPHTADLMFAILQPEELAAQNRYLVKQMKNRYAPKEQYPKFLIGVDKPRMKLYDIEMKEYSERPGSEEQEINSMFNLPTKKTNKLIGIKT